MTAVWWLAVAACSVGWLWLLMGALADEPRVRLGAVVADPPESGWPLLSIVVPSRDEAHAVERATRSLLAQDYPNLQVIAVDDRSTDGTGEILERLAGEDKRLRVLHVTELPRGWLGKTHALSIGARQVDGEWILFTDGDVLFAPDALRRAVAFAVRNGIGHLVAMPQPITKGFLERAFMSSFGLVLISRFRVWSLRRRGTAGYVGIGAFNLVRRADYERVGGHSRLAMEVIDDMKLGLVLRRSGVPQAAIDSSGLVAVRWHDGVIATVRGLIKNSFAVVGWSWPAAVAAASSILLMMLVPAISLLAGPPGGVRVLAVVPLAIQLVMHVVSVRRMTGGTGLEVLLLPAAGITMAGLAVASAAAATWRGGIVWRGTRYQLRELRAGCVRERDWPVSGAVGWGASDT